MNDYESHIATLRDCENPAPAFILHVSGPLEELSALFTSPLLLKLCKLNMDNIRLRIECDVARITMLLPVSYLFDPAWGVPYSTS